jgi:hypothetical protein
MVPIAGGNVSCYVVNDGHTPVRARPGWLGAFSVSDSKLALYGALVSGHAGCLTAQNGGFRPGRTVQRFGHHHGHRPRHRSERCGPARERVAACGPRAPLTIRTPRSRSWGPRNIYCCKSPWKIFLRQKICHKKYSLLQVPVENKPIVSP